MPPNISRLPQELVGLIIGHLEGDKESLSTASILSRRWTYDCGRILFREFKIEGQTPTIVDFISLLKASPEICRCICELEISNNNEEVFQDYPKRFSLCHHLVASVLDRLPRISSLALLHYAVDCQCGPEAIPIASAYKLSSFAIKHCHALRSNTILALLAPFSDIGSLSIENCDDCLANPTHLPSLVVTFFVKPLISIRSLQTGPIWDSPKLLACIPLLFSPKSLTSIDLRFFHDLPSLEPLEQYGPVIRWASRHVQQILIQFFHENCTHFPTSDYWQGLNLSMCSHLTHMSFGLHKLGFAVSYRTPILQARQNVLKKVVDIITTLPPSTQVVTFIFGELVFQPAQLEESFPWDRLCHAIRDLPRLKQILFKCIIPLRGTHTLAEYRDVILRNISDKRVADIVRVVEGS